MERCDEPKRRERRASHFLSNELYGPPLFTDTNPFSGGYTSHKLIFSSFPPTANHGFDLFHLSAPSSSSSESESELSEAVFEVPKVFEGPEKEGGTQGANARACRDVRW